MKSLEEYEKQSSNTEKFLLIKKEMEDYELIASSSYSFVIIMIHILQRNKKIRDKKLVVYELLESLNDFDFRILREMYPMHNFQTIYEKIWFHSSCLSKYSRTRKL